MIMRNAKKENEKMMNESNNNFSKEEKMIRRNEKLNPLEDNQNDPQSTRDFNRILKAAKPLWEQFLVKPEKHTAKGILYTTNDRLHTADLSFEQPKKRVLLMIRLRTNNDLSPSQEQSINKVQNETQGLSSVAFNKNTRMLKIRSQSVLPAAVMARAVVPQVVKDAVALLEDDNLKDIVEQSVSY